MHFTPELLCTIAVQLMGYGALVQKVRDIDRRTTNIEEKIDKWQEAGIGVKLQAKAHSAHGD